jgi:triosephosphate isomerase
VKAGRSPLVVANWKMNKTAREAAAFAEEFLALRPSLPDSVGVAIAPAFPALERLGLLLSPTQVLLAAQDVHTETKGAYTGEVSAPMLRDLGVSMALVGHSERRRDRKEDEPAFARKIERLLECGIAPLYCVGETLEERDGGRTDEVLARQMTALDGFGSLPTGLVVAYEPVWAIGTGRAASPAMAADAHRQIRALVSKRYGEGVAASVRILYGGSVTPANAASLFGETEIDGGLVGGASLVPADFAALVKAAG